MSNSNHHDDIVVYPLLDNGLDFIHSALENLQGAPDPKEIKYGILHLANGIELVLKARLAREDWRLLFRKVEKADKRLYDSGDFESVYFDDCLKRLKKHCRVVIPPNDKQILNELRKKRNKITHLGIADSSEALKSITAKALNALIDFIQKEWNPDNFDDECEEYYDDIRRLMVNFDEFVDTRMKAIEDQLKGGDPITCPSCFQDAALIDPGIECLFCGLSIPDPEEAANRYISDVLNIGYRTIKDGGTWPQNLCPACDYESFVTEGEKFICFNCSTKFDPDEITSCDSCGNPIIDNVDMPLCDYCLYVRVND
jgi:hypothetical protein